jgi:hypothetical protein
MAHPSPLVGLCERVLKALQAQRWQLDRRGSPNFQGEPGRPPGQLFDILCEDHNGTYLLPFPCCWRNGDWWRDTTSEPVDARVIGWRKTTRGYR